MSGGLNTDDTSNEKAEIIGNVRIIFSLEIVNNAINEARNAAFLLSIIISIIAIILLTFFVRLIIAPIKEMVTRLYAKDLVELEKKLKMEGAPYTPGRILENRQ